MFGFYAAKMSPTSLRELKRIRGRNERINSKIFYTLLLQKLTFLLEWKLEGAAVQERAHLEHKLFT